LFLLSVFFSQTSFSVNNNFEGVVYEGSSILDKASINEVVPVEHADNVMQLPNIFDELHDQMPSFSCEKNDGSPRSVLVKNFKKQKNNLLRRNMFKKKYDRLFSEKYVDLHFDPMHGGSFNIDINQKNDDDIEEDYDFGDDNFPSMEDIDYFGNLENELL
jgi:hypothetical protein